MNREGLFPPGLLGSLTEQGDYSGFGGLLGDPIDSGIVEGNGMNPRVKVRTGGSPYSEIMQILSKNSDKDFVKRIIAPEQYPTLDNGDGTISTHSMMWGDADGKFYVYPSVIRKGKTLKRLSADQAWDHAVKTGERIEFDNPDDAHWFSRSYKEIW